MKTTISIVIPFLLSYLSAMSSASQTVNDERSTATTCADPSLTTTYISTFSVSRTAHAIRVDTEMITYDAAVGANDNFQFQGPAFRAWRSPQNFTVPFYQLNAANGGDLIYLPAAGGAAPVVSGFINVGIVGYAYATQVCGSVPLLAAYNAAATDHWWTTNPTSHANMLATGWVDDGIPFHVLPLDCGCSA